MQIRPNNNENTVNHMTNEENTGQEPENNTIPENGSNISIVLSHGGVQVGVTVPTGTDLGHIRSLVEELDEIGAPSQYNLGVNGVGQDDTITLEDGDIISFRPVAGNKG